jgi:hypothetical protein
VYNQPKLNQEDINQLNGPIRNNGIETKIKSLLPNNSQGSNRFTTLKKNINSPKTFPGNRKGILPNSLCEASITLIPKPKIHVTKKENYRPISLMSIDTMIVNKMLANRIQQHIEKLISHDQVSFISGM